MKQDPICSALGIGPPGEFGPYRAIVTGFNEKGEAYFLFQSKESYTNFDEALKIAETWLENNGRT